MRLLKPTYTIDELVSRCKAGERKAQEILYKLLASKMLGVCMRYATDKAEAEDMMQNGFINVFRKLSDYRNENAFEEWVRRIMVHSAIEYHRKYHKSLQLMDVIDSGYEPSVNAAAIATLSAKDLMGFIQELPYNYRMVFNLYAIEGYSHKEIGKMVGITEGASKSQLSRARTILKDKVIKIEDKRYGNAG